MYNDIYIYRVHDVWLIKQGITGFFIIFNTNTALINRPIDLSVLLVQILLSFVLSFVRHSPVFFMSFVYLSITKLFDQINNSIYTTRHRELYQEYDMAMRVFLPVLSFFTDAKKPI